MNYIGVSSSEIAKKRVAIRVSKGGHGIPDKDIERRYFDSLVNLKKAVDICNRINIYDNTDILKLVMVINNGKIVWQDTNIPEWLRMTLIDEK